MQSIISIGIGVSLLLAVRASAIEGLHLRTEGSNAVVNWPSRSGQTFYVQFRPTLNATSQWVTLVSNHPALENTNRTAFVHECVIPVLAPTNSGGNGGSNGPPMPSWLGRGHSDSGLKQPSLGFTPASGGSPTYDSGFYQVETMVGGRILLADGATLTSNVSVTITTSAFAANHVVAALVLDITGGKTNVLTMVSGLSVSNATFDLDTTLMKTGERQLQIQVVDDNGEALTGEDVNVERTPPLHVNVTNAIWLNDFEGFTDWRLVVSFGTEITDGTWSMEIFDDTATLFGSASGDIAGDTNSAGNIIIADPNGFPPFPYYTTEYFDIVITAQPYAESGGEVASAPGTKVLSKRSRVRRRALTREPITLEHLGLIGSSGSRILMDTMMQLCFDLLDRLGAQYDLNAQAANASTWNQMANSNHWFRLNNHLVSSRPATHMYYIGHGGPHHIGYTNLESQISVDTLYGPFTYLQDSNKLTFAFLDGCNSADGVILGMLTISAKTTLAELINNGKVARFGCGWRRKKLSNLRVSTDINSDHAEFVGVFMSEVFEIDPITGFTANTYQQAYQRARFKQFQPTTRNFAADGWDWKGCDALYIDE